jgi:hypothetical protein
MSDEVTHNLHLVCEGLTQQLDGGHDDPECAPSTGSPPQTLETKERISLPKFIVLTSMQQPFLVN